MMLELCILPTHHFLLSLGKKTPLHHKNCKKVRVCIKTQFYRKEIRDEDSSYYLTKLISAA